MARWLRHSADYSEIGPITADDTFVDVGCGMGGACIAAAERGAEIIALDRDPALIEHVARALDGSRARGFRGFSCWFEGGLPLPDDTASVVVCTDVLEHVREPNRLLAELARIGRPGCRYLLSVPEAVSESIIGLLADPRYFEYPGHVNQFTPESFDGLVRGVGLEVVARPAFPNSFYWGMTLLLRAACDEERLRPVGRASVPGVPDPVPPVIHDWNRVWSALESQPRGDEVLGFLDSLLPREHVVVAQKPGVARNSVARVPTPRFKSMRPDRHAIRDLGTRFGRMVQNGRLRLGRLEVGWFVRRTNRAA